MEWNDVVDVLAHVAAFDRRTVGKADVSAWQAAFTSVHLTSKRDALQAVADHYASSADWLMPVHVIQRVRDIRHARVDGLNEDDFSPDIGAVSDGAEARSYLDTIRARRALVLDGTPLADAIAAVPVPDGVPLAIEWTRSEQ